MMLTITQKPTLALAPSYVPPSYSHSGGDSDSDSLVTPDISVSGSSFAGGPILSHSPQAVSPPASGSTNPPSAFAALSPALSSIAEAPAGSGEETDDEEDEPEDSALWKTVDKNSQGGQNLTDIKAGYLWKKGIRRKVSSHRR